nr:hypothetical protein GCM10020093_106500 [Planobispora longispora]
MILLDYVLVPALLYLIASYAMASFVSFIPVWGWLIIFVLLNTAVNYAGIQMTARITKIMLIGELIVLAVFLVVGLVALAQGKAQAGRSARSSTPRRSPGPWSSARSRSRSCPSSASTASRCWPRRTRRTAGSSAGPWWPRSGWRACCSSRRPGWARCSPRTGPSC